MSFTIATILDVVTHHIFFLATTKSILRTRLAKVASLDYQARNMGGIS